MSLPKDKLEALHEIARELKAADLCNGRRGEIARRAAEAFGVSVNTLYGYLREWAGWTSGRKPRQGKGKTCVPYELCKEIAQVITESTRATGKQIMSLKRAVAIAAADGKGIVNPETGEVTMPSVETVSRAMRLYGCHPEQLRVSAPKKRVRSLHPNHTWQLDASVCVLYRIRGTRKIALMDEAIYNEKKPKNLIEIKDRRIIRYIVTDHTTNAFYLHYVQAAGEDAAGVLAALIGAIEDRGPRDPMHGVPSILYMDQGSANRSSLVTGFCEQLGIRPLYHKPKNASATGSVEQRQDSVECEFESRLRFMDVPDVETLQTLADRWRRHFCATEKHSRTNMTRNAAWLMIREEELRTVEGDVLRAIAAWKEDTRRVREDFTISVNTHTAHGVREYDLRELAFHGLKVRDTVSVHLNPYKAPAITVSMMEPDGTKRRFDVAPMEKDAFGQPLDAPVFGESYKALPKTRAEKVLEEVRAVSHTFDLMADVKEAPLYLRKTGTSLQVETPTAEFMPMKRLAFAMMMRRNHPDIWNDHTTDDCAEWLRTRYPDSIPGVEIETVVERMRERFGPKQAKRLEFRPDRRSACAG